MWLLSKKKQLTRKLAGPVVVYTYSVEDTPKKTLGVRVPREAMQAARNALAEAHKAPTHRHAVLQRRIDREELLTAIAKLDMASRANRRGPQSDYYLLGPSAVSVGTGLKMGANILYEIAGREILSVRHEVLTNHQYVDIFRAANRS